jgi:DNA-binding MarR family transcriptional regulator
MASNQYRECNATERDVLYTLRVGGSMTGREIMQATERPEATVSRALESLAEKGLVDRGESDMDGRTKVNQLTDEGWDVTTAAFDAYKEAL